MTWLSVTAGPGLRAGAAGLLAFELAGRRYEPRGQTPIRIGMLQSPGVKASRSIPVRSTASQRLLCSEWPPRKSYSVRPCVMQS